MAVLSAFTFNKMKQFYLLAIFFMLPFATQAQSEKYFQLADSASYYIEKEQWNRAEEKIIEALRLEPANFNNSLLFSNLGIIRLQKAEYNKALEAFNLGLSIAPSSTVLLNNRARTFLLLENPDSALSDLDSSLRIDSLQEWPLQTKAFLLLQKGDLKQAQEIFNSISTLFPDNSLAYAGLAEIAQIEGNTDTAETFFKKSIELNPDDEDTLAAYILLLVEMSKFTEARQTVRKAIEKNPNNGMFYLLRGFISRLNYQTDEALADKKIAISKGIVPSYASRFIP